MTSRLSAKFAWIVGGSLLILPAHVHGAASPTPTISAADSAFFEARIRPILSDKCFKCHSHSSDKIRGGLLLDSRAAVLEGGNSGPVIVAGKPDDSLLIQAIRYTGEDEDLRMPPKSQGGKLTDAQIADLEEWVKRGAPDPRIPAAGGSRYGGVGRNHWAFQPLKKPDVPAVESNSWIQSPVDAFVYRRLTEVGLKPNSIADKRTLIRRVSFDLVG
ncbi:MAG TPA: DUF1549 domain-containing protein, partial [Opitutaceae bacterium]|nr:DUF1549 domain-containing protein [Opitutaceae bacterium]